MLILCCGPDTYRATQRARELEDAFRAKHDQEGSSIERVESGKRAADEVIERSLTVSLFSPMRFIRADGLLESCAKAKAKTLAQALGRDSERVIVVSIEREKPTATALKPFSDVPKLFVYDYPLLKGSAFLTWVKQTGEAMGVKDAQALSALARACDGNAWLASNELIKLAAGGVSDVAREHEAGGFQIVDLFFNKELARYATMFHSGLSDKIAYPLTQQTSAALRLASGNSSSIPSYSISKLQRVSASRSAALASTGVLLTVLSRTGYAKPDESATILP